MGAFSQFGQHTGEDFQSQVLFIPEAVGAPLDRSDLVVDPLHPLIDDSFVKKVPCPFAPAVDSRCQRSEFFEVGLGDPVEYGALIAVVIVCTRPPTVGIHRPLSCGLDPNHILIKLTRQPRDFAARQSQRDCDGIG